MQAEKRFINRDAVAAMLGHVDAGCPPREALVLDIRRHDERSMYGSIPGMHFPCLLHHQSCLALYCSWMAAGLLLNSGQHAQATFQVVHPLPFRLVLLFVAGTVHVPAHQLPMAFQMGPDSWEDTFHFPKPSNADWVIMQCRTNKRATWAAQLAADAGLTNCLIYKQVVLDIMSALLLLLPAHTTSC